MNADVRVNMLTSFLNYYPLEAVLYPYKLSDKRNAAFNSKMLKGILFQSLPVFKFCCDWLTPCETRKSINSETNTFLLKNLCEIHYEAPICEGIFVMAALALDFEVVERYEPFGVTFRLNISQKSVTSKIQEAKLFQLNKFNAQLCNPIS